MEKLEKRKTDLNKVEENDQAEEQRRPGWIKDENGIIHPIFISKEPIYLNEDGPVNKQGVGDKNVFKFFN